MGGDQGPHITVSAALFAVQERPYLHLILCGDMAVITSILAQHHQSNHPQISLCSSTQTVEMDDNPLLAIRNKKDSSMRKALDLVAAGKAQACVSAGNTGALFATAHFVLKTISGVERPALIASLPTHDKQKKVFMLDLGANVFCDSQVLYQFALMGAVMAETVEGITNPRIALLNMGVEDLKGSDNIKQAAVQLATNPNINYIGFIEGNDIFTNKADVIVCDGFVGNVALKTCEGVAVLVYEKFKQYFLSTLSGKILGKLLTPTIKKLFKTLNPDQYNGASLIGLRSIVVKSHGNANTMAFYSAILAAIKEVERQLPDKIKTKLEQGSSY